MQGRSDDRGVQLERDGVGTAVVGRELGFFYAAGNPDAVFPGADIRPAFARSHRVETEVVDSRAEPEAETGVLDALETFSLPGRAVVVLDEGEAAISV